MNYKMMVLTILCFSLITANAFSEPVIFFDEDLSPYSENNAPRIEYPNSIASSKKFQSNLENIHVESFENYEHKEALPLTINFGIAGNATLNGATNFVYTLEDKNKTVYGEYPISGNNFLVAQGSFNLTFEKEQSAFGFFVTDLEVNSALLIFENNEGMKKSYNIPYTKSLKSGSAVFWGIIDTDFSFSKVTFAGQNGNDGFGFDDFTIGTKEQLSYISGCIAIKDQPLTSGKVMLMQSGEIFQTILLDEKGCYKFFNYNEIKPFSVLIRKPENN